MMGYLILSLEIGVRGRLVSSFSKTLFYEIIHLKLYISKITNDILRELLEENG